MCQAMYIMNWKFAGKYNDATQEGSYEYVSKFLIDNRTSSSKNSIVQEYVLPDFTKRNKGYILPRDEDGNLTSRKADGTDQILTMNNERFMIPEILFNPSDIGMNQAGIPEAIFQSVEACDSG